MKKLKTLQLLCFSLVFLLFGCSSASTIDHQTANAAPKEKTDYEQLLINAETIVIEEEVFSLSKKYNILVNEEKVAEVEGDFVKITGDTFTLKDMNGKTLASEKQIKRWGTKLTRVAEIYDEDNNVTGYIGEEASSKLFSIGYFFHFYDENKKEIGISDQVNFTSFKKNNFKDTNDNILYKVNAKFNYTDTYELEVLDSSIIPLYHAIFMVCIEDSIKDSEEE